MDSKPFAFLPISSQRNISIVKHCLKIIQLKSAEFSGEIFAILSNAPNFLLHIDIQRDSLFFIIQKQQWDRLSAPTLAKPPQSNFCVCYLTNPSSEAGWRPITLLVSSDISCTFLRKPLWNRRVLHSNLISKRLINTEETGEEQQIRDGMKQRRRRSI